MSDYTLNLKLNQKLQIYLKYQPRNPHVYLLLDRRAMLEESQSNSAETALNPGRDSQTERFNQSSTL